MGPGPSSDHRYGSFLVYFRALEAGRVKVACGSLGCLGFLVLRNFYGRTSSSELPMTRDEKCCLHLYIFSLDLFFKKIQSTYSLTQIQ